MDMPAEDDESPVETKSEANTADATAAATQRKYSSEEVAEIIRLSLQEETGSGDDAVDYQELLSIAKEVVWIATG